MIGRSILLTMATADWAAAIYVSLEQERYVGGLVVACAGLVVWLAGCDNSWSVD